MPQPITHSLAVDIASSTSIDDKVELEISEEERNAGRLGSIFAIDGDYFKDVIRTTHPDLDFRVVGNIKHWEGSLRFYANMLNFIKWVAQDPKVKRKLKAFADGAYSHAVTDIIFHPFVYRMSQDHWRYHVPKKAFGMHKLLESMIDTYLAKHLLEVRPTEYGLPEKIRCHTGNDFRALDRDIMYMLLHATYETYGKEPDANGKPIFDSYGIDYRTYFGEHKLDGKHPIADAYHDMMNLFAVLYRPHEGLALLLRKHPKIRSLVKAFPEIGIFVPIIDLAEVEEHELELKFAEAQQDALGTNYTIMDVFKMAADTTRRVMAESEWFMHNSEQDAYKFFLRNSRIPFLREDYNLDTGLPAKMNQQLTALEGPVAFAKQTPEERIATLKRIFAFGIDTLKADYRDIITPV